MGRPRRQFTDDEVAHMRHLYKDTTCSVARIARHFGVSPGTINRVLFPPHVGLNSTLCTKGGRLRWNTFAGIRVFEVEAGFKVYTARCDCCGYHHVQGPRA